MNNYKAKILSASWYKSDILHPNARDYNLVSNIEELYELPQDYPTQKVRLSADFDSPLNRLLPPINHIIFGGDFNQKLVNLPITLHTLEFNDDSLFNKNIDLGGIPLQRLVLGGDFNKSIKNLPRTLYHLTLGWSFNQKIDCLLHTCPNLCELVTGRKFNRTIPILPISLRKLILGREFNQPLINPLPNLIELVFGSHYNYDIPINVLPQTLQKVSFGDTFNQNISVIPAFVTHLSLGWMFNQPLTWNTVPPLVRLELSVEFNQEIPPHVLPKTLKRLILGRDFNHPLHVHSLPENLEYLEFGYSGVFNHPIAPNVFPKSLLKLVMCDNFNHSLSGVLPENLVSLTMGCYFDQPLDGLPNSLRELTLGSFYSRQLDILPPLRYLKFNGYYNTPLVHKLPNTLTHLTMGCYFNRELIPFLPDSLTHLIVGYYFNQDLTGLPNNLQHLTLGLYWCACDLPQSLTHLVYCGIDKPPIDILPPNLIYCSFCGIDYRNIQHLMKEKRHIAIQQYWKKQIINKICTGLYHDIISRVYDYVIS
uniref:FNIPrepeat containing protein n=1 Tax=Megaviridae environmental sample TaxID=1737588 RepID=A0A5J6VIJ5_9VIRU|nr:MAG: FNIPrepeat containing protein [Megaviridae environmental sample]